MNDRNIAVHTAFSCLLWPVGTVMILIGLMTERELGQLGLLLAMIAAVLNVRGFFCELHRREREAFEVGREIGAESAARRLRPMR